MWWTADERYPVFFDEEKLTFNGNHRFNGQRRKIESADEISQISLPDPTKDGVLYTPIFQIRFTQNDRPWSVGSLAERIPDIGSVNIDQFARDIHRLYDLENLVELRIDGVLAPREKIDISRLGALRKLAIVGTGAAQKDPEFIANFRSKTLRSLSLYGTGIAEANVNFLSQFPNLRELSLSSEKLMSLGKTVPLLQLVKLDLGNLARLTSLEGIDLLAPNLRRLQIENCPKLILPGPLGKLCRLVELALAGRRQISDIAFVSSLHELRHFAGVGLTVADGIMSHFRKLPNLNTVYFDNRRHYDCRWQDIKPDHHL